MKQKIRLGVLGCSNIAKKAVLPALIANDNFELVLLGSRSPEKGVAFAAEFGGKNCSYDDIIDSDELDAVYVSLPVGMHFEWGQKVLASGKHLLMEKVFTSKLNEAETLIQMARKNNLIAMEALMYVFNPLHKKVRDLIKSGSIGDVRSIEATFGFPQLPFDDIRNKQALGGGAVLDNLIYPLSLVLGYLANDPVIYSAGLTVNHETSVDESGFLLLANEDVAAHVSYGFNFMYRNEYLVWGSEGYMKIERAFSRPANLPGKIELITQGEQKTIEVEPANHFSLMLDYFYQQVSSLELEGLNQGEDILYRMKYLSNIYQQVQKKMIQDD